MDGSLIDAAGLRLRVLEIGAGPLPPVLLVHGVGGWAENWAEVMPLLAADGRRVVAFDLPGFGDSERPASPDYFGEPSFYATIVDAVRARLGLERPHLIGHSLGGGIAFVSAVSHPDRYRSLTLAAPGGLGSDIALFLRLMSLPGAFLVAGRGDPRKKARHLVRTCFVDGTRVPPHLLSEAERYAGTYHESLRVMRAVATMRGLRPAVRQRWITRSSEYRGPALIVWGRGDAVVPNDHAAAAAAVLPQAALELIDGAGHLVMSERPEEFAAVVRPFLQRAERGTGPARTMGRDVTDGGADEDP
ncbi:MAG TPA: alpha/beta fold hydrolase [Candidatus Saccharimonadales bacterium]|nr:alpha/beta fold hydrolase [Candidatus Saccharimonadales bacterium]